MKFSCEKKALVKEIAVAMDIIASKSIISILSNVYLEAEDTTLKIRATDVKVNLSTFLPVTVDESGSISIPASSFYKLITSLPDGHLIFEQADNKIKVTIEENKSIKANLKTISSERYPEFPNSESINFFEISIKEFRDLAVQVKFSVSADQTRVPMTGVFFEKADGKLIMVATDGRRLSYSFKDIGAITEDFTGVIVPPKIIDIFLKRSGEEGNVAIGISDKMVFLKFGNYLFSSQLLEAKFPDYKRVIPEGHTKYFIFNRENVLIAIRRSISTLDGVYRILLVLSENLLTVKVEENDQTSGDFEESLPCEYSGEEITFIMNPQYLLDPLNAITSENVKITFSEPGKTVVIKSEPESDYLHIAMPIQS
jgi:DNA polymerase-3 subunit beta